MIAKKINADIQKLIKEIKSFDDKCGSLNSTEWNATVEYFKTEYLRLYSEDDEFEHISAKSIRAMITINRRFRIIPAHLFGPTNIY